MERFVLMENMNNTYETVVKIISAITGMDAGQIGEKENLYEDLELDSISILELVCQLEEEWNFRLTDYPDLLDEMETIENLVFFLDNNIGR